MATEMEYERAFGFAWASLCLVAEDKAASVETQLQVQRAMDNLRTLYPAATEGLES